MDSAFHYHNLYRQYHSDISMRLQPAKVAAIPHRIKSETLLEENRTAHRWQWVWGIGGVIVAVGVVKYLRQRHGKQMKVKETLLVEQMERLVEKTLQLEEDASRS